MDNKDLEKDFKEAKIFLKERFNEIIEDGQLIGMRNVKMSFLAWADKMKNVNGLEDYKFSQDEIESFLTQFIEEMEKKILESRKNGENTSE